MLFIGDMLLDTPQILKSENLKKGYGGSANYFN